MEYGNEEGNHEQLGKAKRKDYRTNKLFDLKYFALEILFKYLK